MNRIIKLTVFGTVIFVIAAVIAFAVVSLLRGGVTVIIRNVGAEPVRSIIVYVTGNSYSIGDVAPGTSKTVKVFAKGESHIELEQAGKNRLVIGCYFEDGYMGKITAEITPTQVVNIKDEIRIGPF
jgi:hypothetical protein